MVELGSIYYKARAHLFRKDSRGKYFLQMRATATEEAHAGLGRKRQIIGLHKQDSECFIVPNQH